MTTYGKKAIEERFNIYKENQKKGFGAFIVQGNYIEIKNGIFDFAKELNVDGIEIKLGQGAKQGLGGEIRFESEEEAEKYRKMGYLVLEEEVNGKKVFERHTPPGELKEGTIENLITKYDFNNVWIKTGLGRGIIKLIEQLIELNEKYNNIRALTIDGYYGGTGMSPWLIMNETNFPSLAVIKHLEEKGLKLNFDLILAGGYSTGLDVAKALLRGANGVAIGRAINIATSNGSQGVYNYLNSLKEDLQMVANILKRKKLTDLVGKKEYLVALTKEAAEFYGINTIDRIEL
ncbi:MAG: glutamate synthase-related protein, partial [Nanoarchaeota archaeon]